ncbi:hypothetical protein IQ26_03842 [Mesorhizobium tianshanense]|uniref:Uncharacterized protein n=2 Tax=Mesorhizobium tianshanense TaxID=39844 RepID=A0A562NPG7_9HYPH|nr:hypothetical protein IQ26_03842 [Mesorhizobium tianshanense]
MMAGYSVVSARFEQTRVAVMKHELQGKMVSILERCMDMTITTIRSGGSPQA